MNGFFDPAGIDEVYPEDFNSRSSRNYAQADTQNFLRKRQAEEQRIADLKRLDEINKKLSTMGAGEEPEGLAPEKQLHLDALAAIQNDTYDPEKFTLGEQHPDVDFLTRLITKNLGGAPEATINYVKKRLKENTGGEYDVRYNKAGDLIIRGENEPVFKKLETDMGWNPKTWELQDLSDIAYDAPAAIAETLASAGGGIVGGLATLPSGGWGALPGAAIAGGTTAAALETGRQGLGELAGIEGNMDPLMVGGAGIMGGVSPFLFGSGATSQGVKNALRKKLQKESVKRGVPTTEVLGELSQRAGSSGAPPPQVFGELAQEAAGGVPFPRPTGPSNAEYVEQAYDDLANQLYKSQSGVPMKALRQGGLGIGQILSPYSRENLKRAPEEWDQLQALGEQNKISDLLTSVTNEVDEAVTKKKTDVGKALGAFRKANSGTDISLRTAAQPLIALRNKYEDLARQNPQSSSARQGVEIINQMLENLEMSSVKQVPQGPHGILGPQEVFNESMPLDLALELNQSLNQLGDMARFKDNTRYHKFFERYSGFEKEVSQAARDSAKALNNQVDMVLGPQNKSLKNAYKTAVEDVKIRDQYFKDDKKTQTTFAQMSDPEDKVTRDKVRDFGYRTGVNLDRASYQNMMGRRLFPDADQSLDDPIKKSIMNNSIVRAGSGAAVGGVLGYGLASQAGQGHGSGVAGYALGGGALGALTGPRGVRAILRGRGLVHGPWRSLWDAPVPGGSMDAAKDILPQTRPQAAGTWLRALEQENERDSQRRMSMP